MNECRNCNNLTNNPVFCTRSCAAIFNNTNNPKRKWRCKKCNLVKPKSSSRARMCQDCKDIFTTPKFLTVGEVKSHYLKRGYSYNNVYSYIRERSRKYVKLFNNPFCAKCGYNKHVEVAHIKPISKFDDNSKIEDINNPSNLILLCPNCHWELDNL